VPYNFQPLAVTVLLKQQAYTGPAVRIWVRVKNLDSVQQCFQYGEQVTVPAGWSYFWDIPPGDDGSEQLFGVCIGPGETIERLLNVVPSGEFDAGPTGASGEVAVNFVERERGAIGDGDTATVTRYREPVKVTILNALGEGALRPNGVDTVTLTVGVVDATGAPVMDGTLVEIATDLGTVEPSPFTAAAGLPAATADVPAAGSYTGETRNGRVLVTYIAPTQAGDATVSATVGDKQASTVVHIRAATGSTLALAASPRDLSGGASTSTLVATLRDAWGDPVVGATVRIGLADDSGTQGRLGSSDVFTGTTNANGRVSVTFTKARGASGKVVARAEYLATVDGALKAVDTAEVTLQLAAVPSKLYLPTLKK
jgi:hypothetical protein